LIWHRQRFLWDNVFQGVMSILSFLTEPSQYISSSRNGFGGDIGLQIFAKCVGLWLAQSSAKPNLRPSGGNAIDRISASSVKKRLASSRKTTCWMSLPPLNAVGYRLLKNA